MNRYLFKAKRKDNNEWVQGNLLYDNVSDKYWIDLSISEDEKNQYRLFVCAVEVIPETICRYTGLNDKNGKMIFENYIVSLTEEGRDLFSSYNARAEGNLCRKDCVVNFKDGAFMIGTNKYNKDLMNTYLWIVKDYCKVIGNKFDEVDNNE